MDTEGIDIVVSSLAEIAPRMVQDNLITLAIVFAFLEMRSKLNFTEQILFRKETLPIFQTDIAESERKVPELSTMDLIEMALQHIHIVEDRTAKPTVIRGLFLDKVGHIDIGVTLIGFLGRFVRTAFEDFLKSIGMHFLLIDKENRRRPLRSTLDYPSYTLQYGQVNVLP